jgi:hypothetical protein
LSEGLVGLLGTKGWWSCWEPVGGDVVGACRVGG